MGTEPSNRGRVSGTDEAVLVSSWVEVNGRAAPRS